jgi:transposase
VITPGEDHESKAFDHIMAHADPWPREVLGDKGYDDDSIRGEACSHGTNPLFPTKRNRKLQRFVPRDKYSLRNRIERFFNRLKDWRRIATRYEKTARNFLGFVQIVAIRIWTKFVNRP